MTTNDAPMSRRDVWLTIALAVAQGLPEPKELTLYAERCGISVRLESVAELDAWAEHFKIGRLDSSHRHGGHWIHGWHCVDHPTGWTWQLMAYTEAPRPATSSPLAEQVVAAIGGAA